MFNPQPTYSYCEHFILPTGAAKTYIIISKTSFFTGKKNLNLMISVEHIPTGPCGQTSSIHKLQNNGERNHKNPSSRAIKSSLRIWAVSPVLVREKPPLPERWYKSMCYRSMLATGTIKSLSKMNYW